MRPSNQFENKEQKPHTPLLGLVTFILALCHRTRKKLAFIQQEPSVFVCI